jgi:hypothetical protein
MASESQWQILMQIVCTWEELMLGGGSDTVFEFISLPHTGVPGNHYQATGRRNRGGRNADWHHV